MFLVVVRVIAGMQVPDAVQGGQYQSIDNGAGRFQYPDNAVRAVVVNMTTIAEPVRTGELGADLQVRRLSDGGADDGFHRLSPGASGDQFGAIDFLDLRAGTDNAEAAIAVAQ